MEAHQESGDSEQDVRSLKRRESDDAKKARLERESAALLVNLRSGNFAALKTRVAGILNLYPHTRNSDVALALKYWEVFHRDIFNPRGISPQDFFRLERYSNIIRVRAQVQNEYGLFQADAGIRIRRKDREDEVRDAVVEDGPGRRLIYAFADETGKSDAYVIVAAVWVMTGRALFTITQEIDKWKATSPWGAREVHFTKFRRDDLNVLPEYLDVVQRNREFLGFKTIATERSRLRRPIDQVIYKLHEHMLMQGAAHEIESGRIELPQNIDVTLDDEQSLDSIAMADLHRSLSDHYRAAYAEGLTVGEVKTVSSRLSAMVQLADVVAGAIGRKRNFVGDRNYKDEMADMIIDRLDLQFTENHFSEIDSSVWMSI